MKAELLQTSYQAMIDGYELSITFHVNSNYEFNLLLRKSVKDFWTVNSKQLDADDYEADKLTNDEKCAVNKLLKFFNLNYAIKM